MTIIDNYVIFSNHPQTLKSIIDDHIAGNTLAKDDEFKAFASNFEKNSNLFFYIQSPILLDNLQGFLSEETWKDLKKNQDYVLCFPHIGFQLAKDRGMFKTKLAVQFKDLEEVMAKEQVASKELKSQQKEWADIDKGSKKVGDSSNVSNKELLDAVEEEEIIELSDISPDDLSANKYEEKYTNGELKFEVSLKNGLKHGVYREYYESGRLKIKGKFRNDLQEGIWKEYDEEGETIKRVRYVAGQLMD